VQPVHVAGYIEQLQATRKATTVKQHLACIRMLFDWLVVGHVVESNPAHAVRGPRHSVMKGSTTVMSSQDASAFLKSIDVSHVVGLRDRAFIGVMVYAFARVSAVVGLKVEDYFPLKKRWWLRLHEENGKVNEMGCHHKLEQFLDEYIAAAGIAGDKKGAAVPRRYRQGCKLSGKPMSRVDAWYMVRRARRTPASRLLSATTPSGPSASPIAWKTGATSMSPGAWPGIPTSRPRSFTTGATMK
jgi:integrase/recombinase XerD